METKTTSKKGQLIRRLHTLRGAAGMTQDEYETLLGSYGVESSKELEEWQLVKLCEFLGKQTNSERRDADVQRKRLLAAVCAFCEETVGGWERWEHQRRLEYAKAAACRAAEVRYFNKIGLDRLRGLTYAFQKRKRDLDGVMRETYKAMGI